MPSIAISTAPKENYKFKFLFEDSSTVIVDAENYRDAAILMLSNRIRAKKPKTIMGAWSQEGKSWNRVAQTNVNIAVQ